MLLNSQGRHVQHMQKTPTQMNVQLECVSCESLNEGRCYPNTRSYLGSKDGTVFILLPGSDVTSVGHEADYLPQAVNAGF
jgi:hypothetical protein